MTSAGAGSHRARAADRRTMRTGMRDRASPTADARRGRPRWRCGARRPMAGSVGTRRRLSDPACTSRRPQRHLFNATPLHPAGGPSRRFRGRDPVPGSSGTYACGSAPRRRFDRADRAFEKHPPDCSKPASLPRSGEIASGLDSAGNVFSGTRLSRRLGTLGLRADVVCTARRLLALFASGGDQGATRADLR